MSETREQRSAETALTEETSASSGARTPADTEADALAEEASRATPGHVPEEADAPAPVDSPATGDERQGEQGDERRPFGGLSPSEAGKASAQARRARADAAHADSVSLSDIRRAVAKKAVKGDTSAYRLLREIDADLAAERASQAGDLRAVTPDHRHALLTLLKHPDVLARAVDEAMGIEEGARTSRAPTT